MYTRYFLFTAICLFGAVQASEQRMELGCVSTTQSERLSKLLDAYFEDLQRMSPELATHVGKTREFNGRWSEYTEEAYAEQIDVISKYVVALLEIDPQSLSLSDQINYNLLLKQCQEALEGNTFGMHVMPLDHLGGIPLDVEYTLQTMPTHNKQDYENIVSRLEGISTLIDQAIVLLDKGLSKGITPPQVVLRNLPDSVMRLIPEDVKSSVFYQPFTAFPEGEGNSLGLGQGEQDALRAKAFLVIAESVYPAFRKFHDYLVSTYIPGCRTTIGACDLPNGSAWYQYCVRKQTTTKMTPEEIHAIGLSEVERIRSEIQMIVHASGFNGTVDGYFAYLNASPEFYYDNAESLLEGYRAITHYIDGQLPLLFNRLPKLPYEVVPMPSHTGEGQISAYYSRGSVGTGRPGRFFVNTHDVSRRPKWQMESLALHEAVPGHHFQISIAQEIDGMPEFRKYTGYTAYIEGWGLYSESLGSELGLYRSTSMQVGRLIEEVWRAVRLVVDTGMHALGWTREQAIDYFVAQTGMNVHEATTEIDRYIVWPGQALAYKIGELSIKRWRQEAAEALGDAFDIREFHDALLELGALPLDVCEERMHAWAAEKK